MSKSMHSTVSKIDSIARPYLKSGTIAAICCIFATGCDWLPSDGPNANQVVGRVAENVKAKQYMQVAMVGIDARVAGECQAFHAVSLPPVPPQFRRSGSFGRAGVGD